MQENKELYFGYFKHISQNIIFNDYVNLLPLNSYYKIWISGLGCGTSPSYPTKTTSSDFPMLQTCYIFTFRVKFN